jgi:hypothetical protein
VEISQHVVDLLPVLRGEETTASTSESTPSSPSGSTADGDPGTDRSLGAGGKAGIGLLVGGVALAATGGGLVGAGVSETREGDALEGDAETRDLRPIGYALLGVGAAVIVTGAVLLGLDRRRARRHQVAIAPAFGPRMTGFSLTARF